MQIYLDVYETEFLCFNSPEENTACCCCQWGSLDCLYSASSSFVCVNRISLTLCGVAVAFSVGCAEFIIVLHSVINSDLSSLSVRLDANGVYVNMRQGRVSTSSLALIEILTYESEAQKSSRPSKRRSCQRSTRVFQCSLPSFVSGWSQPLCSSVKLDKVRVERSAAMTQPRNSLSEVLTVAKTFESLMRNSHTLCVSLQNKAVSWRWDSTQIRGCPSRRSCFSYSHSCLSLLWAIAIERLRPPLWVRHAMFCDHSRWSHKTPQPRRSSWW